MSLAMHSITLLRTWDMRSKIGSRNRRIKKPVCSFVTGGILTTSLSVLNRPIICAELTINWRNNKRIYKWRIRSPENELWDAPHIEISAKYLAFKSVSKEVMSNIHAHKNWRKRLIELKGLEAPLRENLAVLRVGREEIRKSLCQSFCMKIMFSAAVIQLCNFIILVV